MKLKENLRDPSLGSHFAEHNVSWYIYLFLIEQQPHSKLYQVVTSRAFYLSFMMASHFLWVSVFPEILPKPLGQITSS